MNWRWMLRGAIALCGATGAVAGTLAIFRTTLGEITVELFDREKPVTVQNFIRLAESGAYSNCFFHRCIPDFVVQGGGMWVASPTSATSFANFDFVPDLGPITNEFAVGPRYSNTFGTIAMAKLGGDPDSATSEFFFNLGDNSANLDYQNGGFTVFGRIVSGSNVLAQFNFRYMWYGIVDLRVLWEANDITSLFSDLPVTYPGAYWPNYNGLIYCGVEIQKTTIAPSGSVSMIAWNSPVTLTQRVEYASLGGTNWTTLATLSGTAQVKRVLDPGSASGRIYRVRSLPP
jgi:cyclophilin family peptidyl-prolyl cis-trans isomerase